MSTRCNIIIKDRGDRRIYLYHHHDGYPEGVGSDLKKYLSQFQDWQFRQHGAWKFANDLVKNKAGLDDDKYEVSMGLHSDIDYCYVINCSAGTLRCYSCRDLRYNDNNGKYTWHKVFLRENLREIPDPEPEEPQEEVIVKRNDRFEAALSETIDHAIDRFNSQDGLELDKFVKQYSPVLLDIAKGPFYIHIKKQ